MLKFKKNTVKNICFVGFMGSGKSILGKDLSKLYNIEFFDSDLEIEKKIGKSINQIFIDSGEEYFRKIEEKVCIDLLKVENCIISLGGGSIINSKIRKIIKKNSFSIYLKVDINVLLKRLKSSKKRPLLKYSNKEDIKKLYNEREIFYNKSDLVIDNNNNKYDAIQKIKVNLKKYD
tara:strand:- start:1120 stop:1647 length:528 start_codon:yes stop_codon:yes gene_type:complete